MRNYNDDSIYDIILFPESIYYLSIREAIILIQKLKGNLKKNGYFIITIADPLRYNKLIKELKYRFNIIEEGFLKIQEECS